MANLFAAPGASMMAPFSSTLYAVNPYSVNVFFPFLSSAGTQRAANSHRARNYKLRDFLAGVCRITSANGKRGI